MAFDVNSVTREQARAELAKRSATPSNGVTREQARAELTKRADAKKPLAKKATDFVENLAVSAAQTFGQSVEDISKTLAKGAPMALRTEGIPEEVTKQAVSLGEQKLPTIPQTAKPGVSKFIGELAGYAPAAVVAGETFPITSEGFLGKMAQMAVQGGEFGGAVSPDDTAKGALAGAVLSPVLGGALDLGGAATKALSSPVKSGSKGMQQVLRKGFSGELYPFMQEKTDAILGKFKGNVDKGDSDQVLFDNINKYYEELNNTTEGKENGLRYILPGSSVGDYYGKLQRIEPKLKKKFNREPYDKAIAPKMEEISRLLRHVGDESPQAESLKNELGVLNTYKKANISDFETLDDLKKIINRDWQELPFKSPIKPTLSKIKDGIRETIKENASNNATNQEYVDTYLQADKRFKDEIVPFRETLGKESPFFKRYKGTEDVSGMAREYVKPSKIKDTTDTIDNLFKISPNEQTKNLAIYNVFKDTENDPKAFIKRYSSLGEKQKQKLFPDEKEELDKLEAFNIKHPKAFNIKAFDSAGFLPKLASYIGGGGLLFHGSPLSALGALAAPYIIKQGAKKLVSNPEVAEFMLKDLPVKSELEKALKGKSPIDKQQIKTALIGLTLSKPESEQKK